MSVLRTIGYQRCVCMLEWIVDFDLPNDIQMLQDSLRRFVDRELIPIEMTCMAGHELRPHVRTELEKKARDLGLWLIDTPEEFGGQGLGLLAMAVIWMELSRTIALPPRGPGIFGPEFRSIVPGMNQDQRERYLFPFLRGEKNTAFAQTEPDAGADPGSMRTTAMRDGNRYIVNGTKRFISFAADADFFQVVVATDRQKGSRGGLSLLLIDRDSPGLKVSQPTTKMMGDVTYELVFEDVCVPIENRVGAEGQGMALAQSWITKGRVFQASRGAGVAQRCLELGAHYASQRITFGAPLRDRQAVQFMLADTHIALEVGRNYIYRTSARFDAGRAERDEGYIVKVFCTELGFQAADRCMQIHGGMGLTNDLPIAKMWKDARSFTITEGAVEVMRSAIARQVFRKFG